MLKLNKIYCGDCKVVMKEIDNESINCCITSPPYWALRCYLPDTVKLKDTITGEEKESVLKELTLLGISSIIR